MAVHLHHVPGRLRVRVPEIKGRLDRARTLESSLLGLAGVSHVETRELTGSVVVHYNPRALDMNKLLAALGGIPEFAPAVALPACRKALKIPSTNVPQKIAGKVAEAVAWHLLEKAAERAIPLLIAAVL